MWKKKKNDKCTRETQEFYPTADDDRVCTTNV